LSTRSGNIIFTFATTLYSLDSCGKSRSLLLCTCQNQIVILHALYPFFFFWIRRSYVVSFLIFFRSVHVLSLQHDVFNLSWFFWNNRQLLLGEFHHNFILNVDFYCQSLVIDHEWISNHLAAHCLHLRHILMFGRAERTWMKVLKNEKRWKF